MRYTFIRKADQVIKFQIADGETLEDSPITYVNDATVLASLYAADNDAIFEDLELEYVTSSDGEYRGLLESSGPESPSNEFNPPLGTSYRLEIVVSTPSGANRTFVFPAEVTNG